LVIENGMMTMEDMDVKENAVGLPEGWEWTTLGKVCTKIGDIDHKMPKQQESGYPYVSTKDFTDDLKISFEKAKFVSKADYDQLSRKIKPERGDIIFPRYGTIGKNILIDFDLEFLVSYSCAVLKPNRKLVLPEYLYSFTLSPIVTEEIRKYVVETTQANVGIASIKLFVFPLPPLAEQERIVSKIEELFSELEKGKEQILLAQQQLKTYRQAVLKWAFEGRLTNADVVDGVLPEGWETVTISDVAESCLGKMLDKQKNKGDLKPYLGNINVRWNSFDLDDLSEMRFEASEQTRFGVVEGDLIICEGGEPGRAAIWKGTKEMMIQKALHRVRFGERATAPYFLHYLFLIAQSKELQKYFTGTTIKHLTGGSLKKVTFPLAPLKEQHRIVQEIESRLSVCDAMEATLQTSLAQAEVLRQSVLKRAFEGRLV
jgi:type I restriction enzyme, S subunit